VMVTYDISLIACFPNDGEPAHANATTTTAAIDTLHRTRLCLSPNIGNLHATVCGRLVI